MKLIIVTYSNESFQMRTHIMLRGNHVCYYGKNIFSLVIKRIFDSDIKLIARPKK